MDMQGNPTELFDMIDARAVKYDIENPAVWQEFVTLALKLIGRGIRHYGAKAIMEVVRYHRTVESSDPTFKIDNNYTSYYARKFAQRYPQYADFFETRRSQYDETRSP
jgi:hypothetical protein